jgi:hypothetical protein
VVALDGFSARTIDLAPAGPRASYPDDRAVIESERFRVQAAADGTLTVTDHQSGRRLERLHALEDEADMGDLYNFCPVDGIAPWRGTSAVARVLRDGPTVWELEVTTRAQRPAGLGDDLRPLAGRDWLEVRTLVRLVRGSGWIDLQTTVDNTTRDHRLRALFPVGAATGPVRAESQFALVRRPLIPAAPRTDWVEPPDATQHTLGAVALGSLALLTRGLPEYEARIADTGPELCLTLLRCVGVISHPSGVLATRPLGAGPQVPTPEGQCLGRHELRYALVMDADWLDDTALLRLAQSYRSDMLLVPAGVGFDAPIALEGDVVFSCLKGAEDGDGLILRCFNPAQRAVQAHVSGIGVGSVARTRLDELGEQPLAGGEVTVGPGEIATLRLRASADAQPPQ